MESLTICFSAKEILNQFHQELIKAGVDLSVIPAAG
jgi:hypothetical protein